MRRCGAAGPQLAWFQGLIQVRLNAMWKGCSPNRRLAQEVQRSDGALAIWTRLSYVNPEPRRACKPLPLRRISCQSGGAGLICETFICETFICPQMAFVHALSFSTSSQCVSTSLQCSALPVGCT